MVAFALVFAGSCRNVTSNLVPVTKNASFVPCIMMDQGEKDIEWML